MPEQIHYWNKDDGEEFEIEARINKKSYKLISAKSIFSSNKIDLGTSVLLDFIKDVPNQVLDLGCGFGPITLSLAKTNHNSIVYFTDINKKCMELTKKNATRLGLENVKEFEPLNIDDTASFESTNIRFDAIFSNPPLKVGKTQTIKLIKTYMNLVSESGYMLLVIQNNLGAISIMNSLHNFFTTSKEKSKKGYSIIKVCH